jgi:phosphoribosylformylglycinamidine synthase
MTASPAKGPSLTVSGTGLSPCSMPRYRGISPDGITALSNTDGRITALMPHPERVFRTVQNSWHPDGWGEDGPWTRMFRNAREWTG